MLITEFQRMRKHPKKINNFYWISSLVLMIKINRLKRIRMLNNNLHLRKMQKDPQEGSHKTKLLKGLLLLPVKVVVEPSQISGVEGLLLGIQAIEGLH